MAVLKYHKTFTFASQMANVAATTDKAIDPERFVQMMKDRDIRAMEMLYDQYSPVLYGVIHWITNDEKKSEEVLYKTFTYIWNHFNSFDVSVHNVCLWMVNIARKFSFEILSPEERLKLSKMWLDSIAANRKKEEAEVLGSAFFKGMSVQKMAEKFNCTETKIRTLLHEAVDHLKREYVAR